MLLHLPKIIFQVLDLYWANCEQIRVGRIIVIKVALNGLRAAALR